MNFRRAVRNLSGIISHVDMEKNRPMMVDVSSKSSTTRTAKARATVILPETIIELCKKSSSNKLEVLSKKGPVISTSIIAGVMAAKRTADLIPFCHPIALEDCQIDVNLVEQNGESSEVLQIDCVATTTGKTGVEMEAMVGASAAALCVYDMLKGLSHDIVIKNIALMEKSGGQGKFDRSTDSLS